jgi:hypothetical protein
VIFPCALVLFYSRLRGDIKRPFFPYKTKALPLLYSNGSYILLSLILTDLAFYFFLMLLSALAPYYKLTVG